MWTHNGKTYGLPQEAYTIELYYNKELMKKIGVTLPPSGQVGQAQFLDIVKKAGAAGITPISQGMGDRPYPGVYMSEEALLRRLGRDDYGKLLTGKLSYKDPRVVESLTFVKSLVDAGAYPKSFATLKLGESHYYFHTKPGSLMFPMGSFYTGRAFVPPDKGRPAGGVPAGRDAVPGHGQGRLQPVQEPHDRRELHPERRLQEPEACGGMLNEMATPEMGTLWLETILLQTAIKSDPSKVGGKYAEYFRELLDRNKDAQYFVGIPRDHIQGKCKDVFTQVLNNAFPGGLLTVDAAVDMLNQGCYTG